MRLVTWGTLLFACAMAGTGQSSAQTPDSFTFAANEPQRALKEGKVVRAVRLRTPPTIDGRLTDEVWTAAEAATGLVQRDPDNGKPMTEATRVQVAYDDRFVYVAVTALDREPSAISAGMARRDEMPQTDLVAVSFDPRHDHRTGYMFMTSPSAWQGDMSWFDDTNQDRDYNAVWDVRTAVTDSGWTAEYRIPFSQMRFSATPGAQEVWGFTIHRQIRRRSELGAWVARARGERGEVSFFGHLVFDEPLPSPKRLELMPYIAARSEHLVGTAADAGAAVGLDMRAGIGTGATFSATVNPDFGQVEQDPAVLNLSVFETFFPEKRPFFLEDSRTFVPSTNQFQLFHSRRIGRAPGRLPLAAGDRVLERPDETTILGAGKVTGKGSGWTYGALSAVTAREYADVERSITRADGTLGTTRQERLIEPATSYNVARVQRDVRGASTLGVMGTAVIREQSDDAFTGGVDYNIRWDRNRTGINGHWVVTHAPGAGGMTSSGGGFTNFGFGRKHVNTGFNYDHFGRDFRVNDIGFFRTRGNRNQARTFLEVGQPDPWKRLRRIWSFTNIGRTWTDEGLMIGGFVESGVNMQFRNFWNLVGGGGREIETFDDLDTRGGPPILRPARTFAFWNVNSDSRKSWRYNGGMSGGTGAAGGHGLNMFSGLSVQASDRLQSSVNLSYNRSHAIAQWVTNTDADNDAVTDHVYGVLKSDVIDITVRGTYAFSRDLTLQAYLQPFVAVGDYSHIRKLARPRSFEFEPVAIGFNPDFNRKSLRGNIVMRWEYVPGSTLFFVWDLSQSDGTRAGEFSPLRDLRTAFGANASHVVMVKASYWLNR